MTDLETFTAAYIEALYFTDTGDIDQPPADAELSPNVLLNIQADCRSFWRRFGCYITTDSCADVNSEYSGPIVRAGHDFHYTRNGHGVGFWESEWPKCYRDMLTKGAKSYSIFETYLGDDNLIEA